MNRTIAIGLAVAAAIALTVLVVYNTGPRHKPPTDQTATPTPGQFNQ